MDPKYTKRCTINQNKFLYWRKGRSKTITPEKEDLPKQRLDASNALEQDYFRSLTVKCGRENLRCILYTCLTVIAVQIKALPMLNKDSGLKIAMHFLIMGQTTHSNQRQRTNFFRAKPELSEYVPAESKEKVSINLIQRRIKRKFNPSAAPQVQGVWDKLVGGHKKALYALLRTDQLPMTLFGLLCVLLSGPWTQDPFF